MDTLESGKKSKSKDSSHKREGPLKKPHPLQQSKYGRSLLHDVKSCPARDVVCRGCGKRGHYQRTCRSVIVSNIHKDSDGETSVSWGR